MKNDPTEERLAEAVALADSLAPEYGYDPDAVAAEVARQMPDLTEAEERLLDGNR